MPDTSAQQIRSSPTLEDRPLCAHVSASLTTLVADLGPAHQATPAVLAAMHALTQPLRVAVGGRISKGKSTLVNALLGQPIAPTGAGETTRLVAVFRQGPHLAGEMVLHDGSRRTLALPDRRLPEALTGLEPEQVAALEVDVAPWPASTPFEIVDTPGLAGLHSDADARTQALLHGADEHSRANIRGAEALVFLMDREDAASVQAIADFADLAAQPWGRCVNVVGVLNRADMLVSHLDTDVDCLGAARRLADDLAARPQLKGRVAGILPLVALLAQSALVPGTFTPDDAAAVRGLANLPAGTRLRLLASTDTLRADNADVDHVIPIHVRARLLDLLGLWGLVNAIEDAASGPVTAATLTENARARSGIDDLVAILHDGLASQVDALKAQRVLAHLGAPARRAEAEGDPRLATTLAELAGSPQLHRLAEIFALGLRAGGARLPASLSERLDCVAAAGTPAGKVGLPQDASALEVAVAAREAAVRMQALQANPAASPDVARVADVLRRSYRLAYQQASRTLDRTPDEKDI